MGGTFIIWIWVTGTFIGPSILTNIREHDKNYNKWEGHSLSQNVTGVLDRNAPDVVVEVLRWVFKLRTTLSINKPQRMGTRLESFTEQCWEMLKSGTVLIKIWGPPWNISKIAKQAQRTFSIYFVIYNWEIYRSYVICPSKEQLICCGDLLKSYILKLSGVLKPIIRDSMIPRTKTWKNSPMFNFP